MGTPTFGGGGGKRRRVMSVGMYGGFPAGDSSLEEFEKFSLDRRSVLAGIDRIHVKGLKQVAMTATIDKLIAKYLSDRDRDEAQLAEDRHKDHLSPHFLYMMYSLEKKR